MVKLFEPKLIGLVNDDEEHFIMRRNILLAAFRMLCVENLIELQVIVVMDGPLSPGGGT
jgi:hypothetical protein